MVEIRRWRSFCALFYLFFVTFTYGPTGLAEITAQLGHTVNLTCSGQDDITGLVLKRSDLDPPYVFFFRDNRPDLTKQNKLFQDRVKLPGPLLKNDEGDVVLYLSNVSWSDNGTYSCRVHRREGGPVKTSFDVRVIEPDGGPIPTDDSPTEDPLTEDTPTDDSRAEAQGDTIIIKFAVLFSFVVTCFAALILLRDCLFKKKEIKNQ
ncbi:uncharacterized protein LOC114867145 isoform X2 [Betta splendens]|uniref:Uncharacterized protein LOC114867145 isoform X2 n=1 Tax=Betta splendens TaxID=158456 RepID=A0A6P7NZF3_BETSP|nr:uncharacterized protein LOC114867145 isoform X2 [Betta splendens]